MSVELAVFLGLLMMSIACLTIYSILHNINSESTFARIQREAKARAGMPAAEPAQEGFFARRKRMKIEAALKAEADRVAGLEAAIARNWEIKKEKERLALAETFSALPNTYMLNVEIPLEIFIDAKGDLQVQAMLTQMMRFDLVHPEMTNSNVHKELFVRKIISQIMDEIKLKATMQAEAQKKSA